MHEVRMTLNGAPAWILAQDLPEAAGERGGPLDFSTSPTWTGLGPAIGAVRDELWAEHSHFIPMEAPARVAALLAEHL